MDWLNTLGKDRKGSRPRCVLLTDGYREEVAERLTRLVGHPDVLVQADGAWLPDGKQSVAEAELGNPRKPNNLVSVETHKRLQNWWLPVAARTPNWDIASTCSVKGRPGLLLVEAKAHATELARGGKSFKGEKASINSKRNHERIGEAIEEASAGLRISTEENWNLSRDSHYQLSNRFAWAWKLASLGVPVVLVYLGFLEATEMAADKKQPLDSLEAWEIIVKEHSKGIVPDGCWGDYLYIGDTPLLPLIQACRQSFCSR